MINEFSAAALTLIGMEIEQAVADVAQRHGISIRAAGGTFEDTHAVIKLALLVRDAAGEPITPERSDFLRFAGEYGLQPTDIDREFVLNGYRYKIVGLKTARPKYPVLARKKIDGRMFKFSTDSVKFALAREDSKLIQPDTGFYPPQLKLLGGEEESG